MSVPFISASLHNLIPIVFFIAFQIMNTMANTVPLIAITSNNFVPNFTPEFVIGTASVSQIPANKCGKIAPTTSSIFSENRYAEITYRNSLYQFYLTKAVWKKLFIKYFFKCFSWQKLHFL